MNETGWQDDGSYVPCPECNWKPPPDRGPGRPAGQWGTTHFSHCPTVPRLTPSPELRAKLDEIAACHRRARAEAMFYVIG